MKITLNKDHAGIDLIYEAENVKIIESIEKRTYEKKEDGSPDFRYSPHREVEDATLDQFSDLLVDLLYYRDTYYDGSILINALFTKLPDKEVGGLLYRLRLMYDQSYEQEKETNFDRITKK